MLELIVQGDSGLVTAEQFATMVDVAVRMIRDASAGSNVNFVIGGLHASQPTLILAPQPTVNDVDVDAEFENIADRLETGIKQMEVPGELPDWISDATAEQLYQATKTFGESSIDGLRLGRKDKPQRLTRETYRTLDRILHSYDETIGSIEGMLITATLDKGAHVSVRDGTYGKTVRCYVSREELSVVAGLIGKGVVVTGRLRRDHLGRPHRMTSATVKALGPRRRVTVSEIDGVFSGPDSVEWLREQRA